MEERPEKLFKPSGRASLMPNDLIIHSANQVLTLGGGASKRGVLQGDLAILCAGAVALGSDANPGTCGRESVPFAIVLACHYEKLTPTEAIVAAMLDAAYSYSIVDRVDALAPGESADVLSRRTGLSASGISFRGESDWDSDQARASTVGAKSLDK